MVRGKESTRPVKKIDWELVDKLLMAGCFGTEIAPHFDMHEDTFYQRVLQEKGIGFTEYSRQKRSHGDSCLRAKQFEKALKGDNSLLIWLGKNRLNQSDAPQEIALSKETLSQFNSLMSAITQQQATEEKKD